ncbi:MAG: AraC family transcriptional regulator ligand-binding domain-containing protein, partial [Myxococcales bacterium]|nr:AraC family transcriptional regulator ligand-binding domain-containing protein [Myxococcales bacterium]
MSGGGQRVWLTPYVRFAEAAIPDTVVRSSLFERAGIPPSKLAPPHEDVSVPQRNALMVVLAEHFGDPHIGLTLGAMAPRGVAGALDLAMRCSSDVRSALGVAERYWQVLADATTAVVVELGEEVGFQLTYGFGPAEARRHTADLTIASLVRIVGDLASAPIAPSRIELSYPPNATPERYRAAFGTDRVEDGGRQSALWYRAADTRIPSVAPDAALDEVLQQHLATLSARLPASSTSIRSRVRRVLVRELPAGSLSLDSVAKHLGQSPRTLQRRLAEEDTRWAELVDET